VATPVWAFWAILWLIPLLISPYPLPMPLSRPIILTGAAGFIGSHVTSALLLRGERVIGIDNFDPFYPRATKLANIAAIHPADPPLGPDAFELIEADITDAPAMHALFQRTRPSAVIHLAAKAGVRPSIADPAGYMHNNVTGTQVILSAAHAASVERAVLASSSSVYGNLATSPFAETADVSEPISPYAASKRACELLAHSHWHLTKMPTALLRFFTVFGPRQRPDLAISSFLTKVSSGQPIDMFGDGSTSRDYTFAADITAGVLAALDRIHLYGYRIWNLGGSNPVSLKDMISAIARVVGKEPIINQKPMQPGDVLRTAADLTRSAAELDYRPETSFENGVRAQWAAMQVPEPSAST